MLETSINFFLSFLRYISMISIFLSLSSINKINGNELFLVEFLFQSSQISTR